MWDELWGRPRIAFGVHRERKKGICSSKSFGKLTEDLNELTEAAANYDSRLAEKLRHDKSCATLLSVRLITNRFRADLPQYFKGITLQLRHPANNTVDIVKAAVKALTLIYKPGYKFIKVEVLVTGIIPQSEVQLDLFNDWDGVRKDKVSKVMDKLNMHFGKGTLCLGTEGFKKAWNMRQNFLSPDYTTDWDDIIKVQ